MQIDRCAHEATLKDTQAALVRLMPQATRLLYGRARALDALGRNEEATRSYVEVLRVDPRHFDALTALGALLLKMGHRSAAKAALCRALETRPRDPTALANFAHLVSDEDQDEARTYYERALSLDPHHRGAHRGIAILLLRMGQAEAARRHAQLGFEGRAESWPYRGEGRPLSVLIILSANGGNVPIEAFVDDRQFLRWTLAAEFFDPAADLPPHDVVFNAVGDADRCAYALEATAAALARTKAPVVNPPSRVRVTGRAANAEALGGIEGVLTARTRAWSRESLAAPDAPIALAREGFRWPLLLRAPGFHTGEHFVKVDDPAELPGALSGLPSDTLLVLQFIDTRGSDGSFRKYRAMVVDGELYPLHVAISARWKVHYFSADMADRPEHRAEDEAFLRDMPATLGPRVMRTLESIQARLGLDYGGIDFAIDDQGRVVVFEANATMAIVRPSQDARWSYRVEPVERVRRAVHRMLERRAAIGESHGAH